MKKIFLIMLFVFFGKAAADNLSADLMIGYHNGVGFEGGLKIGQFAEGFPFHLRFGIGYTIVANPGKTWDVRRIFINDATGGDPEKKGHFWDFNFDLLYQVRWLGMRDSYLYVGPRYSAFNANFKFIGGNEFFDIESSQWGLGAGLIAYFHMGSKLKLVTSGGLAYYFKSPITGHDTTYSPDGEHINPRPGYGYEDADKAIYQPRLNVKVLIGINYLLK